MKKRRLILNRFGGFTLIELLVVMAILGLLALVSVTNFRNSQMRGRDLQRKSDLHQIRAALEAYMSDHGGYPEVSATGGKIVSCVQNPSGQCQIDTLVACEWKTKTASMEFCDINNTSYMQEMPGDPTGSPDYCYKSAADGSSYQIYAKLENSNDLDATLSVSCNNTTYNFGLSSGNTTP